MPIYKANGKTYNIPEEKIAAFEKHNPNATVDVYDGATGKGYTIPVGKRGAFQKKYPKWSYGAPKMEAPQPPEGGAKATQTGAATTPPPSAMPGAKGQAAGAPTAPAAKTTPATPTTPGAATTPATPATQTAGATSHAASTTAASPAAPKAPETAKKKEAWQPTPIQKAFVLDRLSGVAESKKRMQDVIDNSQRVLRSMTQEGRDEAKAGEMTARMAGKYKKPLGLMPTVGEGGEAGGGSGTRSQQSPVVKGVKMVDGELQTEYQLPDGSLTTNFADADKAEYNARGARLQHEFEKRMAQNGLDPSKQEDIEEQRKRDLLDESEKRVAIRLRENEAKLRGVNERKAKRFDAVTDDAADGWRSEEGFWDNFTRIVGAAVNRGSQYAHPTNRPEESLTADERDERLLTTEHNVLTEAKNRLETRQLKKSNGFMGGFWNVGNNWRNMKMGARHTAGDVDLYAGGIMSLQKATQMLDMENKLKAGEDLTDAEVSLLYSTMLGNDIAHNTETPHGYNAAQITVEMFPFMAQMMLNPASGLSEALVKKFGKSGLRKIAMTVAGDVAESAVLANTLQAPKTAADAIERYQGEASEGYDEKGNRTVSFDGNHSWGEAIAKGEGSMIIENYTEMLGEHFGAIKDFAGKWIGKGVGKLGGGKIVDAVTDLTTKVKTSDWGKAIGELESRAHWNGTVGEVLEEEAGIVLNSIFTGDNKLSDLTDADQQIDIVLGVGLFGGFVSGIKTIGYPIARAQAKSGLRKADGVGGWRFGDAWGGIRSEIDNAEEADLAETVRNLVSTHAKSEEQMRSIVDYAKQLMKARGMNLAVAQATAEGNVTPEQQDAEESYAHGADIAESGEPEAMRDVRINLDRQRKRLVAATSEEFVAEHFDGDGGSALDNLTAIGMDDDLREIALDYVNARHVYDGMIQGVRDDIDGRIAQSDAEIEGRTHRSTGLIIPATMKVDDRQVYVVSGFLTTFDDGSGIDEEKSDDSVIVRDAETGKLEFAAPSQILNIGESIEAVQEKQRVAEEIRQETAQEAVDAIDGQHTFDGGETYRIIYDHEGHEEMISILGPAYGEDGTPLADAVAVQMEDGRTQIIPTATLEGWIADTERIRAEQFETERDEEREAEKARADEEARQREAERAQAEEEARRLEQERAESGLDNPNWDKSLLPETWQSYDETDTQAARYTEGERGTGGVLYRDAEGEDAIVVAAIDDNTYVGYQRIRDKETGKLTNRWTAKFQNGSADPANFRAMMQTAQELLPAGHELTEMTSVSTDGLRNLANQLRHGYELQHDDEGNVVTERVAVNMMARENALGLPESYFKPGSEAKIRIRLDEDERAAVNAKLAEFLAPFGLGEDAIHWEGNALYVEHPVLRRADRPQEAEARGGETTTAEDDGFIPIDPALAPSFDDAMTSDADAAAASQETELTKEGKRGYDEAVASAQTWSGEKLDSEIAKLSENEELLTEFGRGWLEGLKRTRQAMLDNPDAAEQMQDSTGKAISMPENTEGNNVAANIPPKGNNQAQNIPADNPTPSALERIERGEDGTPLFESADPETAWDALVEDSEDEEEATGYAEGMIKVLEKEAEKARKKLGNVKVTGDRAKYKAERTAAREELERIERSLAAWQGMLGVRDQRKAAVEAEAAAQQAAAEAEERRKAAERAEQERQERERRDADARAEAERLRREKEERDGIPEMAHDTPEAARQRGKRRIGTTVYERQEPITQKIEGKEVTVDFNEKREGHRPKGRLVVIEAAQGQASHMEGSRNPLFFIDEAQPKDRTDAESVLAEQRHAKDMDPSLITDSRDMVDPFRGAPTVNMRGETIQGNHRMGTLRYMYANEPESAARYRQYLLDHASEFGLTEEQARQVASMKEPVLVNMVDVDDAMAIELGQDTGNARETGGKDRIDADRLANTIGDKMGRFMDTLLTDDSEEGESLRSLIRRNGLDAIKYLRDMGKIDDRQYGTAIDKDGNLTDEGVEDVEKFIKRTFFAGESREFEHMFDTLPAKAQSAVLSQIWRDTRTEEAHKATPHVKEAVKAFYAMQSIPQFKEAKNFKDALRAAEMWRAQTEFNADGDIVSNQNRHSNFAIRLAAMMKGSSMKETRGVLKQMLDWMQEEQQAEPSMFEGMDEDAGTEAADRSFAGAVRKVLDMEYQPGEASPATATLPPAASASAQNERPDDAKGEKTSPGDKPADADKREEGASDTRKDGEGALDKTDKTDKTEKDNGNGENGGVDVAGGNQARTPGKRGGRGNGRGGERTEGGKGTSDTGAGAGPLEGDGSGVTGRSLTEQEAEDLISRMESDAETAPVIDLTPENWIEQFGEDGTVMTPVGEVKMGENQYFKLAQQGRNGKLGMVRPTLTNPDVIIEDYRPATNGKSERDTAFVFVKTFIKEDGGRYYHFTSVTVRKDGREVVISNQERNAKRISKLLQEGNVTWINGSLHPKAQGGKSVSQNDSSSLTESDNGAAMLGVNSSAEGKDDSLSKDKQAGGGKSSAERELTAAELDAIDPEESGIDESVIDGARDYLEGERTPWSEMCYNTTKDYVRNTRDDNGPLSDTEGAGDEELPGADSEASGGGERTEGSRDGSLDREDGGGDVSGSGESRADDTRGSGPLPGEEGTGSTEGAESDADAGHTDTGERGGGRRAGGKRGNVRKPRGKRGGERDAGADGQRDADALEGNLSPEDRPADAKKQGEKPSPTASASAQSEREETAQGMIDDALATLKDIFKNPGMSRPGQLNDVTTLLAGLGVNAARFLGATAKLGCGLVMKGYYRYAKWRGEMHRNLDPLLMAHTDLTDEQADEFIASAWDMKMTYRGARKKISEWAAELEQEELRRLAQMGLAEKRKLQAEAEGTEVIVGDLDNIRETLPFLLPAQHEDVEKAERQFFKAEHGDREHGYGKGYLFTNGTGTGKTYTGLGIVKRFLKQGKGRVLIVTVNDTKISDWIKDAKNLGIEATQLPDTKSKGKGVVVTQYANLRQNYALLEDQFDLIVYDESHKLMENQEGEAGSTAAMHHMVAARDARAVIEREVELSELGKRHREAAAELNRLTEIRDLMTKPESLRSDKERDLLDASGFRTEREIEVAVKEAEGVANGLAEEMDQVVEDTLADATQRERAEKISKDTKTVFLSATPFNTPASLDYAEGYIFTYNEGKEEDDRNKRRNAFLRKNFGRSHRMNKQGNMTRMSEGQIADPQAVEEEEINFSNYLQETLHTMSGRMLDSAYDYSRSFPRFDFEQADMLNNALSDINDGPLKEVFKSTLLDYNYSTAFWEIIKTQYAIPRIKEHLALGRKVVVFHRRKASNQGVRNPFGEGLMRAMASEDRSLKNAALEFAAKYAPLLDWERKLDYTYPQDRILQEFVTPDERADYEQRMKEWEKKRDAAIAAGKRVPPEPKLTSRKVGIFNGDRTANEKQSAVDNFNLSDSDQDVIVVQVQSGKEGISLHDTEGKRQRVMMSLALPQSPIEFIQAEGRIYRVGNMSNAIFEYPLLGIDRELYDFAMKINGRSQTSENLAMGDKSRGLRDSITRGALGSTTIPVTPDQGVGGKMLDSRQTQNATDFDHAMTNWKEWRENEEGIPYDERSIPDPLGFKIMEWGGIERGETVLVAYAGEGSAARYAPSSSKLIALESNSGKLARLAALLGGGGRKILGESFPEYSVVNKADIVVVKPSEKSYEGGELWKRDLDKAIRHTEDSGRIIAIVGTDRLKGVDGVLKFIENQRRFEGTTVRTVINLPEDVFGKQTSVVVIDRNLEPSIAESNAAKGIRIIDAKAGATVEETLSNLREQEVEKREVDRTAKTIKRVKKELSYFEGCKLVSTTTMRGSGRKKDVSVNRRGVFVHFKKFIVPNDALPAATRKNGIYIEFNELGGRPYLEQTARIWAGCRKYSEMSEEDLKEELGPRMRTDAELQEAQDIMNHLCSLIEAATGKTATQLANISEGKVENEIKKDMTLEEFKDIYKSLDSGSEELDALAERVFAVAGQIDGLSFKLSDRRNFSSHNTMAHYAPGKNAIELNADQFNSPRITDEQKAQCILHEAIHAVTCWAIARYKNATEAERRAMGPIAEACQDILDVYKSINNDDFRAQLQSRSRLGDNAFYGLSDEYEMVAEMANPVFRRALKAKRLWRQLVNGVKKLFGIDVTDSGEGATTAYETLNRAINTILDHFDGKAYGLYRSNPLHNDRAHEMRNLFDEEDSPTPSARQRSLFEDEDEAPWPPKGGEQTRRAEAGGGRKGKNAGRWVQTSLFDEETPKGPAASASAQYERPKTPEEGETARTEREDERQSAAIEVANRAIDEYAEAFGDLYAKYSAFIEGKEELADDLWDRLEGELDLIGAMLEGELTSYYLSEGNTEEDAARMARDKAGLVRAEVTLQLARPEIMMRDYRKPAATSPGDRPADAKNRKKGARRGEYRSAAAELLEWQSQGEMKQLKDGEFAAVERQFAEDGMFPFLTGAGKIETDADVAYLFRCLENSAIEQAFAVLVKDGKPLILHIGMGSQTASMVDKTAVIRAMDAYGADRVYFVHNHPGGTLRQSQPDEQIYRRIRDIVGEDKIGEAIIIDTTSGRYAVFGETTFGSMRHEERRNPEAPEGGEEKHGVLSFSRQVFAKDYDLDSLTKIKQPEDVAAFVSARRLGEGGKVGYLLLSRQNTILGAMQSSHSDYSDAQGLAREATSQAVAHGATGVILYGNAPFNKAQLATFKNGVNLNSGGDINVLDAMQMKGGLRGGFMSAIDEGIMEPQEALPPTGGDESGLRFRMREKEDPKKTQRVYKLMRLERGRLYPLFIDGAEPTELGVWYDADSPNLDQLRGLPSGTYIVDQTTGAAQSREEWDAAHPELASTNRKTGEPTKHPNKEAINYATLNGLRWIWIEDTKTGQRRFGGEARKYWNLGINGSGSVSTFSMRPGWHAGSLPTMRQIGKGKNKDLRDDRFVWVEGEVSADVDYNAEAERNPDKDLPDRIPEDGYYMKATNADQAKSQADRVGWYVAGSFRANRIISDAEAREIIDAHNAEHPEAPVEYDYRRESGLDFTPTAGMNQGAIYPELQRDGEGAYTDDEVSWADDPWSRAAGESLRSARQRKAHAERVRKAMREKITRLAEPYGIEVEIIEDASSLRSDHNGDRDAERKRNAKGWYDPQTGKITIVLGNHSSTADAQATLLHEMVGHKGLRALFGARFEAFLDAVWAHADNDVKERISLLASRNGWDRRTATEEYMAQLAEDGAFANAGAGWWQKLKALFMDFLRGCGFSAGMKISDNELRYVLWMSWKNLKNPGAYRSFLGEAARVAKEYELGVTQERKAPLPPEGGQLFRDGDFTPRDRKLARDAYEGMLRQGSWQFREATQDSMLGLRSLYEAILTGGDKGKRRSFRIEDVAAHENAYVYENRMSSANNAEQHEYFERYMRPLLQSAHALCGKDEDERRALTDYMMAKHGLERNDYMRNEAIANGEKGDRDFAGLCGLTGEKNWKKAEAAAQKMADDYERDHDKGLIDQLWSDTKRATTATLEKIYLSGLISEDTYRKTLGMYDHYIPLRGWEETTSDEVYGYLTSPDGPLLGSVWKHAEGRESKADDPIATIAKMGDDAIRQGNRNVMKQRMLNFVHGNPSDAVSVSQLWLEHDDVTDEWRPVFADLEADMTAAEIERELKLFEEKMEGLAKSDPDHYKRGRDARNIPYKVVKGNVNEHQVLVKRNGHTYVMTINGNPRAAQALNGLTNPDTDMGGVYGKLIKGASYVNRQLSAFYTTRNPDFVMSNFLRDALYSNCMTWVKESPRYALLFHRNFGRVNPAVMARLLRKWEKGTLSDSDMTEKAFREFMLGGGETGYTNLRDIEQHKKAIAKEMKRMSDRRSATGIGRATWRWLTEKLDLLNRSVENTARFAAFLTSRQMGRGLDRSIYDAKEISVNFNKKGAGDRFVDAKGQTKLGKAGGYIGGAGRSLYVFWNAGVQGMTNFGRAAKRNPKKGMAGAAALFTLGAVIPLLAQMLSGDGDDDKNAYYNLPEYIRRSNICFRAGDHWITIPLPIEYRAIYGLGELATGVISGKEHYSDAELAYYMAAQMSQVLPLDFLEGANPTSHDGLNWKSASHPFIPSAVKPFMEAYIMNRGWTGMPVAKETPFNELDPEFKRVYQSTDQNLAEMSRWLNNSTGGNDYRKGAIDVNPAKIEYLLNGTFGGMFSFPMKLKKTGETVFGDRDFEWRNMPLANRVVKTGDERTENRKLQNEYYKYRAEAERTEHEFSGFMKEGAHGIMESARRADLMYNSEEFLRWRITAAYEPTLAALRKAGQEAPEGERKEWQREYYARMRELVDALHDPRGFLEQPALSASAR